ncbi:MAG: prenyltransferase/squalene oxidase repeat-containing protein, partial [Planctomycetota bacterium]
TLILAHPTVAEEGDDHRRFSREFVERVNDAIDRGLLWVLGQQSEDGSWPGYSGKYPMGMTSLALLTVLKCDYPRKSNQVEKAFKHLLAKYKDQRSNRLKTYSITLLMMALEEGHAKRREKLREDGEYGRTRHLRKVKLPAADYKWMADLTKWLVGRQTSTVWRYPSGGIDHSNTQYALLGLAAARRCGVPVDRKVFLTAAKHLLDTQEKTGPEIRRIVHVDQGEGYARRYLTNSYDRARGWGYTPGDAATGSMTTAGVSSLAICRSELLGWSGYPKTIAARMERGIKDGLAWLNHNFSVTRNPGGGGWLYYYLFGLERAGVLTDVRFIGDHDWYKEGADYLLGAQRKDGHWAGRRQNALTNTCFALLFLRRATVPVKVPRAVTPEPSEGD